MGETCTFSESGTSVAKFCDNGCCSNECCKDTSVDTIALAIAIAVILGVLLLIALIILLIYCCIKRSKRGKNKTDWRHKDVALTEMQPDNNRNRPQPNGVIKRPRKTTRHIQTGDPDLSPGDRVLWSSPHRYPFTPKSQLSPSIPAWNQGTNPTEISTQTQDDSVSHFTQTLLPNTPIMNGTRHNRSSISHSLFSSDPTDHENRGVQTFAPNPPKSNRKIQYLPAWTPKAPWGPSAQFKSLTKNPRKPASVSPNPNHPEIEPFYSVHRCPPDSSLDSEHSSGHSVNYLQ